MTHSIRKLGDPALAALLFVSYVTVLLLTTSDLGYARDEGFYFHAARAYEHWFTILFSDPSRAMDQAVVDRYWAANREHPALMKSLFALSHHVLYEKWQVFSEAGTAYRFPGMLMAGLSVATLYLWGRRAIGRVAGLFAAALFALMPRVFYHSHLCAFDVPVAAMWLVTAYAYFRSLEARGVSWAIAAGILYGLFLNTKHNAWLFPFAVVLHLLLVERRRLTSGLAIGRFRLPAVLISLVTIGPLVFFMTWPWLWFDTARRFSEYMAFHLGHDYYNMEFLGQTYWKPPMPRLYAWVMTLGTVPTITLLLFVLGLGVGIQRALVARPRSRASGSASASSSAVSEPAERALRSDSLWLLSLLASYAPWLSASTPIFGGTKHWITAYPFLCLFAARGVAWLLERVRQRWASPKLSLAAQMGVALALLSAPVLTTWQSHPWGLSAYTPLVGGAPGAASLGLNRTFWGYTTGAVTDHLNERAPRNASVYIHDTAVPSWEMLRTDGRVRPDLRGTLNIAASNVALYHHEPHMGRVEHQVWVAYGTTWPAHIGTHHGVPVVWIYERPRP